MREFMTRVSDYLDEWRNNPEKRESRLSIAIIGSVAAVIIVLLILLLWGYTVQEQKKREAQNQEAESHEEASGTYMTDDAGQEALIQEYLTSIQYLGDKVEELLQTMTQVQENLEQTLEQLQEEDAALREQVSALYQEVCVIVENLKETQVKLYDLTDVVQIMDQEKLPLIQQQILEIQQDMGKVHADIVDIYTQLAALKEEDEKLWAGIDALESSLETAMNQNITEVNNQMALLLAQLETAENRIYQLASRTLQYHYDAVSNTLYLMPYEEEGE